jgi:hypothetical protein
VETWCVRVNIGREDVERLAIKRLYRRDSGCPPSAGHEHARAPDVS